MLLDLNVCWTLFNNKISRVKEKFGYKQRQRWKIEATFKLYFANHFVHFMLEIRELSFVDFIKLDNENICRQHSRWWSQSIQQILPSLLCWAPQDRSKNLSGTQRHFMIRDFVGLRETGLGLIQRWRVTRKMSKNLEIQVTTAWI